MLFYSTMLNSIKSFLTDIRLMPIYIFINIRRFFCEKKLKKIKSNDLLENGFIKFQSENGKKVAEYLDSVIKNPENIENSNLGKFRIVERNSFGIKTVVIDSSSEFLHTYVFNDEIIKKLQNFYGKEFYLRNNPVIAFSYDNEESVTQLFHLDYSAKQTSVMINLNVLSMKSTHMEYIKKSNKIYRYKIPSRFKLTEIKKIDKITKNFEVVKTTGEVGQVCIFDAGCGYHRQVSGGRRVVLHLNFTENLAFTGWKKNWKPADPEYWFAEKNDNINGKLFSLVNRKFKSNFFTPKIYNDNKNF